MHLHLLIVVIKIKEGTTENLLISVQKSLKLLWFPIHSWNPPACISRQLSGAMFKECYSWSIQRFLFIKRQLSQICVFNINTITRCWPTSVLDSSEPLCFTGQIGSRSPNIQPKNWVLELPVSTGVLDAVSENNEQDYSVVFPLSYQKPWDE